MNVTNVSSPKIIFVFQNARRMGDMILQACLTDAAKDI